jgi:hypothetical protein
MELLSFLRSCLVWGGDRLVDTSGVYEVHSVTMEFKGETGSVTRHKFFVGTMAEAKAVSQIFDKVKIGDMAEVNRTIVSRSLPHVVNDAYHRSSNV